MRLFLDEGVLAESLENVLHDFAGCVARQRLASDFDDLGDFEIGEAFGAEVANRPLCGLGAFVRHDDRLDLLSEFPVVDPVHRDFSDVGM